MICVDNMPFKIKYKFKEDKKFYTCIVTYQQYKNFKELPIIKECEIVKEESENIEEYKYEMQKAINLAVKNNGTHIRKLSEIM